MKNNGILFSEEDWTRMTKIAEGNPNENSVGCFGVGFYSITEKPIIRSGNRDLIFCWKGDQLVTMSKLGEPTDDKWTSFIFPLTNTKLKFDLTEFSSFLCQSLAFTRNLHTIQVFQNEEEVFHIEKKTSKPFSIKTTSATSPENLFTLKSLEMIQLEFLVKGESKQYSVSMEMLDSNLQVNQNEEISNQMTRVLKKNPPKTTKIRLIWQKEGQQSSGEETLDKLLSPFPNKGKVFIGFVTHQTTGKLEIFNLKKVDLIPGCGFHLAAQFLPTVERENIDFSDYYFKKWNSDLVFMAGKVARLYYDHQMSDSRKFSENSHLHLIRSLPFVDSTPSPEVCSGLVESFLQTAPTIPTTKGIRSSKKAYLPKFGIENFLNVPMVPELEGTDARFFLKLKEFNFIQELSVKFLIENIEKEIQSEELVIQLLRWYLDGLKKEKSFANELKKHKNGFLTAIQFQTEEGQTNLHDVSFFTEKKYSHVPIPLNCLPFGISRQFTESELSFLGMSKMEWKRWWDFIVEKEWTNNPKESLSILQLISEKWNSIATKDKNSIIEFLKDKKCISTKDNHMKIPRETYFPETGNENFQHLPFVDASFIEKISQKLLKELGVRGSIDVKLVFSKLGQLEWSSKKLIDFLIGQTLNEEDWKFLKQESFLLRSTDNKRCLASDLYFPNKITQLLHLPLLNWEGEFTQVEKSFLEKLGVLEHPQLLDILQIAANGKEKGMKETALQHFLINFDGQYKQSYKKLKVDEIPAFLPSRKLCKPNEIFAGILNKYYNEKESMVLRKYLEYEEIREDLSKFVKPLKILDHLPIERLKQLLSSKLVRLEMDEARLVFDYCGKFHPKSEEWKSMQMVKFIPHSKGYLTPNSIFLPSSELESKFGNLLDYFEVEVNQGAKLFLEMVGCRMKPTPEQVLEGLIINGYTFLASKGVSNYLYILHELSKVYKEFKLKEKMKGPIFIGVLNEDGSKKGQLCKASDCYLIDNIEYQNMFNPLSVPEGISPEMEGMYEDLGSAWITSRVKENCIEVGKGQKTKHASHFTELVEIRKGLLIHDLNSCESRENLKKNAESLLKNLKILEVSSIKKELILGKQKKEGETNICIKLEKDTKPTIFITSQADEFALASTLASLLLTKKGKEDGLKFSAILSASIASLRQHGYPVDRLLSIPKPMESSVETSMVDHGGKEEEQTGDEVDQGNEGNISVDQAVKGISQLNQLLNKAVTSTSHKAVENALKFGKDIIEGSCENHYNKELTKKATLENGVAVWEDYSTSFDGKLQDAADEFSKILIRLAHLFKIKKTDKKTGVIGFNKYGTIYFNLLFFNKLHFKSKKADIVDAYCYWFVVFCHELAHNFVDEHNADHSFISEHFMTTYLKGFLQTIIPSIDGQSLSSGGAHKRKKEEQVEKEEEEEIKEPIEEQSIVPTKKRSTRSRTKNQSSKKQTKQSEKEIIIINDDD